MTRTNLAVCFSPVIFSLNYDNKKKIKPHKLTNDTKNTPSLLTVPPNPLLLQVSPSSGKMLSTVKPNSAHVIFEPIDPTNDNSGVYYGPPSQTLPDIILDTNVKHEINSSSNLALSFNSLNEKSSTNSVNYQIDQLNQQPSAIATQQHNFKSTYTDKLNKAANSLVNFGAELGSSTSATFFSDSLDKNLSNLEYMSKVVQLCVADMIKYSMDLFTVAFFQFVIFVLE